MFYGCSKLASLDLANFQTDKIINMTDMFRRCFTLADVDESNFNITTLAVFKMVKIWDLYKSGQI